MEEKQRTRLKTRWTTFFLLFTYAHMHAGIEDKEKRLFGLEFDVFFFLNTLHQLGTSRPSPKDLGNVSPDVAG